MTFGTWLFTLLHGQLVGSDQAGNRYYRERRRSSRPRRWVIYAGEAEPSRVPAEWHAWLHYLTDSPLPQTPRRPWQKPHLPNTTGTPQSYRPPGHDYLGGKRAHASADYEPWTPSG